MDENKKPAVALNDQERFPLISDLSFLKKLKQDTFAPRFNFQSGDRLGDSHLAKVKEYAKTIRSGYKVPGKDTPPKWMDEFLRNCITTVPYYKGREIDIHKQPTICRGNVAAAPWFFVPGNIAINDMLVYQTSGTTGAPMNVLFDPVSQACWLPQLESILDLHGITLNHQPDKVSIALICSQSSTLTYASLSTYLDGAGILKLNLNQSDWNNPDHCRKYLEKYNPQILTGDPFSFLDLLNIKPEISPSALVSSAMKMTSGIRQKLEAYFSCPVIDIYSLTECRMVAFADGERHRAIRPDLYLEVFERDQDIPLPFGKRGELVITGGNNPFLPLIRYRTGDFCSLEFEDGRIYIKDLEARTPVAFYTSAGKLVNNIEISRKMTDFPLAGFTLHQDKNYGLHFTGWCNNETAEAIDLALRQIFGQVSVIEVSILPLESNNGYKPVTYTSELPVTV